MKTAWTALAFMDPGGVTTDGQMDIDSLRAVDAETSRCADFGLRSAPQHVAQNGANVQDIFTDSHLRAWDTVTRSRLSVAEVHMVDQQRSGSH